MAVNIIVFLFLISYLYCTKKRMMLNLKCYIVKKVATGWSHPERYRKRNIESQFNVIYLMVDHFICQSRLTYYCDFLCSFCICISISNLIWINISIANIYIISLLVLSFSQAHWVYLTLFFECKLLYRSMYFVFSLQNYFRLQFYHLIRQTLWPINECV